MRRLALVVGIVFLLCVGSNATSADNSPQIVVERLDCSGLAFTLERGDPGADYWVGIRGDCETFGFLYGVFPMRVGESYEAEWPEEWTFCWMNWDNCWRHGILEPQPEKIRWYLEVALYGQTLSSTVVDLAIPCGHRIYLPLIFK